MRRKGITGRFTFQDIFLSSVALGFLILTGEKKTHRVIPSLLLVGKHSTEYLPLKCCRAALGSSSFLAGVSKDHTVGKGFLATCLALWSSLQCGNFLAQ